MTDSGAVRIALVDDHALFRHGLAEIMGKEDDLDVVASASVKNGPAAVCSTRPDLVLLDSDLFGARAIASIRDFGRTSPSSRVVILSMYDDSGLVARLVDAGASGFMLKNTSRDELLSMVRSIAHGADRVMLSISRDTLRRIRAGGDQLLSAREREVLSLLALGMHNADIARALFITEGTVKRHLTNIYAKLAVGSRIEAANKAMKLGLVPFPSPDPGTDPSTGLGTGLGTGTG